MEGCALRGGGGGCKIGLGEVLFGMVCLAGSALAGNFYAGTSPANVPWPGGIVPYEFTNTLTPRRRTPTWTACANGNWRPT